MARRLTFTAGWVAGAAWPSEGISENTTQMQTNRAQIEKRGDIKRGGIIFPLEDRV
jgi:hypothetical protein